MDDLQQFVNSLNLVYVAIPMIVALLIVPAAIKDTKKRIIIPLVLIAIYGGLWVGQDKEVKDTLKDAKKEGERLDMLGAEDQKILDKAEKFKNETTMDRIKELDDFTERITAQVQKMADIQSQYQKKKEE